MLSEAVDCTQWLLRPIPTRRASRQGRRARSQEVDLVGASPAADPARSYPSRCGGRHSRVSSSRKPRRVPRGSEKARSASRRCPYADLVLLHGGAAVGCRTRPRSRPRHEVDNARRVTSRSRGTESSAEGWGHSPERKTLAGYSTPSGASPAVDGFDRRLDCGVPLGSGPRTVDTPGG